MIAVIDPFAYWLVFFGLLLLLLAGSAGVIDWIVGTDADELVEDDREPTDDEIYNRPGVEGGIVYDQFDEPGSLGEHDWRL